MPMFDIEDCKDVELNSNKTNREKLARVKKVENFRAENNEVSVDDKEEDIVDIKPNFMGIGLNINAACRKLKKIVRTKQS